MVSVTSTVCPAPVSTVKVAALTDWIVPTVARRGKPPRPPAPPGAGKVMIPPLRPGCVGELRAPLGGPLVRPRRENAAPTVYQVARRPATATTATIGRGRRRAGGGGASADPSLSTAGWGGGGNGGGGHGSGVRTA